MLSNALSGRHQAARTSTAPSQTSSTAGPFKVNSIKMHHRDMPPNNDQKSLNQQRRRLPKAASYNSRSSQKHAALPLPKTISLPSDHGVHGLGGMRPGRFTLEGVKEEQPSSFQPILAQHEAAEEAPTIMAGEPEASVPRRWSLLRMFALQKKQTGTASGQDGEAKPQPVMPKQTSRAIQGANPTDQRGLEQGRPPYDTRQAISMSRDARHKIHGDGNSLACASRDALATRRVGAHLPGPPIPVAHPGTASSAGTNWQTPQAELHTPSAYITPVPLNQPNCVTEYKSKEMLQAAQQATPEQARAMLRKFSSIRAQQRRNSQLVGY